jgi:hypothetical protein
MQAAKAAGDIKRYDGIFTERSEAGEQHRDERLPRFRINLTR